MGAGKTSVATLLAERLSRPLRDSDRDLQAGRGLTAAELLDRYGADHLHDWEAAHLLSALGDRPPPVVSAAASVIDRPACREALRSAFVVWLHAPPEVLARRFRSAGHRPRFGEDLVAMLAEQEARRAPHFAEVADVVVDVSVISPEQVVQRVLAKELLDGAGSD